MSVSCGVGGVVHVDMGDMGDVVFIVDTAHIVDVLYLMIHLSISTAVSMSLCAFVSF